MERFVMYFFYIIMLQNFMSMLVHVKCNNSSEFVDNHNTGPVGNEMIIEGEFLNDYLNERDIRVAVVYACSLEESLDMLRILMRNRTVASKYNYFDMDNLFNKLMTSPYNKLGIYLNYTCDFGKFIFSQSSSLELFTEQYVWIIMNNDYNSKQTKGEELQMYNLQLDTDMIYAVKTDDDDDRFDNNEEIIFYDIYKIRNQTSIIPTYAGLWNKRNRLNITLEGTKTSRRSDFQGIIVKGTAVLTQLDLNHVKDSYLPIMDVQYKSHLDILNRFAFIMNMNLAKMYNFTINVTYANDWGVMRPDGLYDGMLGDIEKGISELGLSTVIMNTSLMNLMDFSFPIWKFRPLFIFRNPRTFGTYQALLVPFEADVWIFIICLIVFLIVLLTFIKYLNMSNINEFNDHNYYKGKKNKNNVRNCEAGLQNNKYDMDNSIYKTWSENLVIIIGAFSSQGLASCSSRLPERIILFMALVVGMLLWTFYNSMVVTSLLQPPPPNIHTVDELINSDINIGITNITYYIKYFQMSNDELTKKIYKKVMSTNGFMSPEEGVNLVESKKFSFYGEEATLYPIITDTFTNNDVCRLVELELVAPYYLPCPYKKRSPLKQYVNSGLHLMRERGIIMRELKQWHKPKPHCQGRNDVPSIQLETLIVAYIILVTGIFLSILIFLIEVYIHKRNKKCTSKNKEKEKPKKRNKIIMYY